MKPKSLYVKHRRELRRHRAEGLDSSEALKDSRSPIEESVTKAFSDVVRQTRHRMRPYRSGEKELLEYTLYTFSKKKLDDVKKYWFRSVIVCRNRKEELQIGIFSSTGKVVKSRTEGHGPENFDNLKKLLNSQTGALPKVEDLSLVTVDLIIDEVHSMLKIPMVERPGHNSAVDLRLKFESLKLTSRGLYWRSQEKNSISLEMATRILPEEI